MARPRVRFNVEVTTEDITKAKVGDSFNCIVAQAIARQIPDARKIEVDIQTVRWSDANGRHVFLTPYSVAGYVVAFDAGDKLHPFRFMLRDAVPAAQKRATSEAARAAKKSRNAVRTERQREKKAAATLADPATPAAKAAAARVQLEEAPERIRAAEAMHKDLKAAYKAAGESIAEERITETTKRAAPTIHKKKRREYGQRVLRVNQAEGRTHYVSR
jgi:hypothetical protein